MSDWIPVTIVEKPPIPIQWDYDESVQNVKGKIYKLKYISKETVIEIYIANEKLDGRGNHWEEKRQGIEVKKLTFTFYCNDIGITKQTAYNWMEKYGLRSPKRLVGKFTGNAENYTPEAVISDVRKVLGEIDLDPASCERAQRVVQAKEYWTMEDDALSREWHGRVFLNPPYDAQTIRQFTNKLLEEQDNISSAILLTNNNTDTRWFHRCARAASIICLTAGRINFYTEEIEKTMPTNGQAFFYFGPDQNGFIKTFVTKGLLMTVVP